MLLSRRLITFLFVTAGYSGTAHAQPREVTFASPQFVAHAVSFKALDETGPDWPGSDEVYGLFADFNAPNEFMTSEYEDVDTGETKRFRSADRCLARQPSCDRGASSLHFGIGLWEKDSSFPGVEFCAGILTGSIENYPGSPCGWPDDLIGLAEVKLDQAQLVAALPAVGDTANYTVKPKGGAGSYEFTYRITRLADVQRTIVIRTPPISLQARVVAILGGNSVNLTWAGALSTTVDIYRNGAKLVTTANDGAHTDGVGNGTFQYRVCNLNATTGCSPVVTVTAP
jgi:hypothetical protein